MNKHLEYLRNSYQKQYTNPVGAVSISGLKVYIKEPLPPQIDLRGSFSYVLQNMPRHLFRNVTEIHIGKFPFLKRRQVDAIFEDGIIYLSNDQQDNSDIITDLVHELAHACEELYGNDLYQDGKIKNEFLHKRERLYLILSSNGVIDQNTKKDKFLQVNYDADFDAFLYQTVGYQKLASLTRGLFISPYAATSLREYFANAFENFFVNDINLVKKYCPNVYDKLLQYLEF